MKKEGLKFRFRHDGFDNWGFYLTLVKKAADNFIKCTTGIGLCDSMLAKPLSGYNDKNLVFGLNSILLYQNIMIEVFSKHYKVWSEYETVWLNFRENHPLLKKISFRKKHLHKHNGEITIGDFYGDCLSILISSDESYVAMCGFDSCIVYFLKEPFTEFEYDLKTKQFTEFNVGGDKVYQLKDDKTHMFRLMDDFGSYKINSKTLGITKL